MICDFVIRGLHWENHIVIRTGTTSTAIDDVVRTLSEEGGYDIPTPEWDQVNSLIRHPFYSVRKVTGNIEYALSLHRFPCIDTEVGFKYISAAMKKYDLPAAVAGEESGGFTIKRFPDKDGIIGICMIASMIAWHGKPPGEIWRAHTERYGEKYDERLDIWAPNNPKEKIINSWLDDPPESIAGQDVLWAGGTYHDKVEFILQDPGGETISRLLVRASGTEEINRIYIESSDEQILRAIRQDALGRGCRECRESSRSCRPGRLHRHDVYDRIRQGAVFRCGQGEDGCACCKGGRPSRHGLQAGASPADAWH
jgi:hypothetical protein